MPCTRRILGVDDQAELHVKLFSTDSALLQLAGARLVKQGGGPPVAQWTLAQLLAGAGPVPLGSADGWYRVEVDLALQSGEQSLVTVAVTSGGSIHSRECLLTGGAGGGADGAAVTIFMK